MFDLIRCCRKEIVDMVRNLASFRAQADVILANRQHFDFADAMHKVYTRDFFVAIEQ